MKLEFIREEFLKSGTHPIYEELSKEAQEEWDRLIEKESLLFGVKMDYSTKLTGTARLRIGCSFWREYWKRLEEGYFNIPFKFPEKENNE